MKSYLFYLTCKIYEFKYYNISEIEEGKYSVQTRSQAKSSGTTWPEVHSTDKGKDQNIRLQKQVRKPIVTSEVKGISQIKPRVGQVWAGTKQKKILNFMCPHCFIS